MISHTGKVPRILLIAPRIRFILAILATSALITSGLMAMPGAANAGCAPEANPIVCENSKPGAPWQEWEVDGAGDDSIQGFATDISVNIGERIDFKIDTDAAGYSIDIYRTGWYQGLGARKIDSIEPSAPLPQTQPECLTDLSTELTDCGTWQVSASWDVPAEAVSGVYLAKLERDDNGDSSHITFIVRDESSKADVLVQTSDPTWHAYNLYGGSDFYAGAANGRAYKISYNRPFATRAGIEARDFYFGAEYPLVRFLERNGYDVSYFSGIDTDRHGELLKNHRVFISVGHDEYWSGAQRKNIEDARDAGVNLQFLTGNEGYWRTRYEPSPTDHNDYRTLVSYKETWANIKIDPSTQWTGTWRDPRFSSAEQGGGLPENALTGTAYVVNHGDLPVQVNDREGKLRLWRDTPLAAMQPDTVEDLAEHTVGYESNETLLNGFRPPGLIPLSTTTGEVPEYLQDFGNLVLPGQTTHHTTLYRADSGALVFSAGSIQWTWGLDEWHDGNGEAADERMQQAQVNLLADMDALPATLMDELVQPEPSTDTTAPSVEVTSQVPEELDNGQELTVSGTASDIGGQVAGVEYSMDSGATWVLAEGTSEWSFTDHPSGVGNSAILVRAIDDSGNYPEQGQAINFRVRGPYTVYGQREAVIPDTGDDAPVELGLRFAADTQGYITGVRFFKSEANTGTHTGTLWSLEGQKLATTTFRNETSQGWQSASFDQPVEVQPGDEYVVSYSAPRGGYASQWQAFGYRGINASPLQVAGGFGTPPAGVYSTNGDFPSSSWERTQYYVDAVFETGESVALGAYGHLPLDTAHSVPVTSPVSATLSKPVLPESVNIEVRAEGSDPVQGSTSYDPVNRLAAFTPAAPLAQGTNYVATISAQDYTGNTVSVGERWGFRTVLPTPLDPNDCPCGLFSDSLVPEVPAVSEDVPLSLGTRFSSAVDGTLTGLEFYRSIGESGPHTGWLYSSSGEQLAEVKFEDDSVTGWQFAQFDAPVKIRANTEYVAAYRSNGTYPVTPAGLADPLQVGPLRTSASAGHYSYSTQFPGIQISNNYLVDVRFEPASQPVTVLERQPEAGASDVALDATVSARFSQSLQSGATLELSTPTGAITGSVQASSDGKTLSFTPQEPLPPATVITVSPRNIVGVDTGAAQIEPWTFRTSEGIEGLRSFLGQQQPAELDPGDNAAVEVGMRMSTEQNIEVRALRYYQGPRGSGTHTATVWDPSGRRLASVTFAAAASQGWQTAYLDTPLQMAGGAEFIVSYHAPNGGYVHTPQDFLEGKTDGVLSLQGQNGVFAYGPSSAPTNPGHGSNYFVDLLYTLGGDGSGHGPSPSPQPSDPPQGQVRVTGQSPQAEATNVPSTTSITMTFSETLHEGAILEVSSPAGPVAGALRTEQDGKQLSFAPSAPLPADTVITVAPRSIVGSASGATDIASWSFRTAPADPANPGACPCGLYPSNEVPAVPAIEDGLPVTLGTSFSSAVPGELTGLKFYRSPGESGTNQGWLYSVAGEVLGEVQFSDPGVPGWQHATFSSPIMIQADTEYVVAYRSNRVYPVTPGGLGPALEVGPLRTAPNAGRYTYGQGFPSTGTSTSYLVDVSFQPADDWLEVTSRTPADGAADVPLDTAIQISFNGSLSAGASLKVWQGETELPGTVQLEDDGTTLAFLPEAPMPPSSLITVSPRDIKGTTGSTTSVPSWSFRTVSGNQEVRSLLQNAQPQNLDPGDDAPVELGVRLRANQDLEVLALRYYQGPLGTGARTGTLWDSSGKILARTDFKAAAEEGWQVSYLDVPLTIRQGTDFTVSYRAPRGGYVFTTGGFADGLDSGPLSLQGPNGVFAYGAPVMPTESWNDSNYFVDLLFAATPAEAADEDAGEPIPFPSGAPDPTPHQTPSETPGRSQQSSTEPAESAPSNPTEDSEGHLKDTTASPESEESSSPSPQPNGGTDRTGSPDSRPPAVTERRTD